MSSISNTKYVIYVILELYSMACVKEKKEETSFVKFSKCGKNMLNLMVNIWIHFFCGIQNPPGETHGGK